MQEIVIAQGVSSDTLLLEDESLDTLGNAIFSARRFLCKENPGTLFVITSPFHMERSLFIFRHVLGAKWTVLAHEAPEWSGETRQTHAATAMARAREFFENIEPGDVEACLAKLVQSNQAYRDKVA